MHSYNVALRSMQRHALTSTQHHYDASMLMRRCINTMFSLEEKVQSTLVISTSLISNNRLSRSENLVPVLTLKSNNRYQNIVEKRRNKEKFLLFSTIFSIYLLTSGVKLHIHLLNVVVRFIVFLNSANLICQGTDISKYSRESLGLRDNESRLYLVLKLPF